MASDKKLQQAYEVVNDVRLLSARLADLLDGDARVVLSLIELEHAHCDVMEALDAYDDAFDLVQFHLGNWSQSHESD